MEKFWKMTLDETISNERKNKGFSQEGLAENSGISLRTIQRIENDKVIPRPDTLKIIADALNLGTEELVPWKNRDSELSSVTSSLSKINLINSSALFGVLFPF